MRSALSSRSVVSLHLPDRFFGGLTRQFARPEFIEMSDDDQLKSNCSGTFSFNEVVRHMRIHHPGCPKKTCLTIAARVSAKNWKGRKLGAAVGIELQNHVRHSLTDYGQLLRSGMMTREEARAFIEPQVEGVLRAWREPALKLRLARSASAIANSGRR